jgi:hypothetical protein
VVSYNVTVLHICGVLQVFHKEVLHPASIYKGCLEQSLVPRAVLLPRAVPVPRAALVPQADGAILKSTSGLMQEALVCELTTYTK